MSLTITKEEAQIIGMYLNVILHDSQNLTSDNTARRAASIKCHAEVIQKMMNRPRYKCAICKDTGKVEGSQFLNHSPENIPCPSCKK